MKQPDLKLPYEGNLTCSQKNFSEKGRTHNKENVNAKYALDFTSNREMKFKVLASHDGTASVWKCCKHNSGNCSCGLGFGNQIRIYHDKYFTFYAHLSKILIKNKQKVKQGQVIGISGQTGLAGDIHLHWTLGKESEGSKILKGKFIPFWSIKANNIEIKEKNKIKNIASTYFKGEKRYISTNKQVI